MAHLKNPCLVTAIEEEGGLLTPHPPPRRVILFSLSGINRVLVFHSTLELAFRTVLAISCVGEGILYTQQNLFQVRIGVGRGGRSHNSNLD
jgi:hypothetical protein